MRSLTLGWPFSSSGPDHRTGGALSDEKMGKKDNTFRCRRRRRRHRFHSVGVEEKGHAPGRLTRGFSYSIRAVAAALLLFFVGRVLSETPTFDSIRWGTVSWNLKIRRHFLCFLCKLIPVSNLINARIFNKIKLNNFKLNNFKLDDRTLQYLFESPAMPYFHMRRSISSISIYFLKNIFVLLPQIPKN